VDDRSEVAFEDSLKGKMVTSLDLAMIKVEANTGRASVTARNASASNMMMAALGILAVSSGDE